MEKYKLAKGWTKRKVMNRIKEYNDGSRCIEISIENISCVYESKNGNRCAIGCFIPDNHQALSSRDPVKILLKRYPELVEYMPFHDTEALRDFQNTHDVTFCDVYESIKKFLDKKVE